MLSFMHHRRSQERSAPAPRRGRSDRCARGVEGRFFPFFRTLKVNVDLHSHSTRSDGKLAPSDLVRRAAAQGVTVLALTDHDEVGGLAEARIAAWAAGIAFVPGVEISVSWGETTIHVLGLGIDAENGVLGAGLASVRRHRATRAEAMAAQLEAIGIRGSLEGAYAHAENPELVSRTHFARYLVAAGYARDPAAVFRHYLTAGKPGYVPHRWAALQDAVAWIRAAGGIAVIAHPGRCRLSGIEAQRLVGEFREAGGGGIEVATGSHESAQASAFGKLAREHGLAASRGSDFHAPGEGAELGRAPALAPSLEPVWTRIDIDARQARPAASRP